MILVGVSALGMAFLKVRYAAIVAMWVEELADPLNRTGRSEALPIYALLGFIHLSWILAWPFLTAWTLGLLALRLRRPRPRRARLCRQPGTAAVAAVGLYLAATWLAGGVAVIGGLAVGDDSGMFDFMIELLAGGYLGAMQPGLAVAASWTALALAGCLHPERSWIDRAGRAVGVAWLLAAALDLLCTGIHVTE